VAPACRREACAAGGRRALLDYGNRVQGEVLLLAKQMK